MFRRIILMCAVLMWCGQSYGAHPLITDDAGTAGRGHAQVELNGEYDKDGSDSTAELGISVIAGMSDEIDAVLSVPYQFLRTSDDSGVILTEDGISDISMELKWRVYENAGLSLALKPGVTFPSGDEDKGIGDGKASYGIMFIATKVVDPFAVHMNAGFTRNREELRDVWHYSLAGEYGLTDSITLVGNICGETNPDRSSDTHPALILGGIIYSLNNRADIDVGIKAGLNNAESDYAILAGTTLSF